MHASRLPNGIRVLTEELADCPSVTVGIWVENGSRYESASESGLSHFLEHLFFKGTTRRSAARIAQDIDGVGGVINAFTGKEHTCYWAKVLPEHLPTAVDVLSDIFTHSLFAEEEIDRERGVVAQEISQVEDTPDDFVHELFNLALWPDHPLARPVAGTVENVERFSRGDLLGFIAQRYRPDRIVLAAAGNLRHDAFVAMAERYFGTLDGVSADSATTAPAAVPGLHLREKPLEQAHLCLGCGGISVVDTDRYTVQLINLALGGGMSSRLFQEIRERRGRAYSVYSFLSSYCDAGYVGVYVGTSPQWVPEVVAVSLAEIDRLCEHGLEADELVRTRHQMKGGVLLSLETSDSRMYRLARNELYFGRDIPLAEVAACIDAVTNEDVIRVARRLFRPRRMTLTVLGSVAPSALDPGMLQA